VHRRPEERPQLRFEQLGLIEAHPDCAPSEKRVGIGWITTDGQLVAADIEGANHNRPSAECLDDVAISAILFLLVGHRGTAYHEKLGAHKADAFRAAVCSRFRLLGRSTLARRVTQ